MPEPPGPDERAAPLKILILAPQPFFQERGTPIAVRNLASVLARNGYAVDVLAYPEGTPLPDAPFRVFRSPGVPGVRGVRPGFSWKKLVLDASMLLGLARRLRTDRYDVIHAVEESAFMALLGRWIRGVPFVYDMDSSLPAQLVESRPLLAPLRPLLDRMEAFVLRRSAGVVAVCRSLEDRARRTAPGGLIRRIEDPSLVDTAGGAAEDLRKAFGITGPLVLYVGNLEAYQGVDLLIRAFATLPEEGESGREPTLVLIGGTEEHIDRHARLADGLGVGDRVVFAGPRPVAQLGGYLRQADVLVSPRVKGENTPMKVYSYLESGVPVLATDLYTHTQVLDPRIAMLAPPEPVEFGRALARLLRDGELRRKLAERARSRARAEFSLEAFEGKVLRFYADLADRLRP